MATDKFIQCFACINVLLLVGVIVYAVVSDEVDDRADGNQPDQPFRFLRGSGGREGGGKEGGGGG